MTRIAVLVLTAAVFAAFSGSFTNELVDWDDEQLLITNDDYQGLGGTQLRWMFTTGFGGHYQPLTWLSFAVENELWGGVNAAGIHFSNILLHLATAIGFYFVARQLIAASARTGSGITDPSVSIGALAAALVFAVHPLRVESVAWATERRDVLSGFWLMLCVFFYLRAVGPTCQVDGPTTPTERRRAGRCANFAAGLACYAVSLLSKATGMTLPVVLFLIDAYPLRRLGGAPAYDGTRAAPRRILGEKLGFAIPAAIVAVLAVWAQRRAGAMWSFEAHPLSLRIAQAFYGIVFYLWKTLWPVGLVPLYEQRPEASPFDAQNIFAGAAVVAITIAAWRHRRRFPALLAAWGAYVVLLAPMLGLAQSGPQLVADRYSYIACMPWAMVVGGAVAWLWGSAPGNIRRRRVVTTAALVAVVAILILLSRDQTAVWKDSYTLWTTTVDRRPDTPIAHANLAVVLNKRGEYDRAREHALTSLKRLPDNRTAHLALARAAMELDDLATAERHLRIGIEVGDAAGKPDPAVRVSLATILTRQERFDEAGAVYRSVIALEPSVAEWHYVLAGFLASRSRFVEARGSLEETLRLDPNRADACLRLGIVYTHLNEPAAAIAALDFGLSIDPDDVNLRAELAWVLATCPDDAHRDGARALELARGAAADSTGQSLRAREALAAALAETGDFTAAASTIRALMDDPKANASDSIRDRWRKEFDLYSLGKPWRGGE